MKRDTFVYVISTVHFGKKLGPCKCGVTSSPKSRLASLQTGNPSEIEMSIFFGPFSKEDARTIESQVHQTYQRWRLQGEWFAADPKIIIDHVGTVIQVMFACPNDPVENAKRATSLGFYIPRMMQPVCNPDGSEYTRSH